MPNTLPELKVTAQAADGKTYWLAVQQPEDGEGLCDGCAFSSSTCMKEMPNDACSAYPVYVWKEKAPAAFGCQKRANGGEKCEKYCGSTGCVTSQE